MTKKHFISQLRQVDNGENNARIIDATPIPGIEKLFDNIKNGIFITKNEIPKIDLKDVKFLQVREKEYVAGAIKKIAEKLDAKGGDTTKSDPPVILADKFGDGLHFGIGGNHTKQAVLKSKHAVSIKWNLIPLNEHETFSEMELNVLGNMLNAIPDNVKNDIDALEKSVNELRSANLALAQAPLAAGVQPDFQALVARGDEISKKAAKVSKGWDRLSQIHEALQQLVAKSEKVKLSGGLHNALKH
jgi:hypothetical protein